MGFRDLVLFEQSVAVFQLALLCSLAVSAACQNRGAVVMQITHNELERVMNAFSLADIIRKPE
jgi:hypothetical protein